MYGGPRQFDCTVQTPEHTTETRRDVERGGSLQGTTTTDLTCPLDGPRNQREKKGLSCRRVSKVGTMTDHVVLLVLQCFRGV